MPRRSAFAQASASAQASAFAKATADELADEPAHKPAAVGAMRSRVRVPGCVLLLVMTATTLASAQDRTAAGRIKIASGAVFIVRANDSIAASAGQDVFEADTVKTGSDGRVGITLKDDTRLSLGPNSEIRLDQFAFAPADGRFAFVLKVVRGVAAYVSGRIAKIAPDAVRLETPSAIVGVRGTTLVVRAPQAQR